MKNRVVWFCLIGLVSVIFYIFSSIILKPVSKDSAQANKKTVADSTSPVTPTRKDSSFLANDPGLTTPLPEKPKSRAASFESARDYWLLANSALQSKSSGDVFEAYTALAECKGIKNRYADLRNFSAGAGNNNSRILGDLTVERQKAIEEIIKSCQGFIDHSGSDIDRLKSDLLKHGKNLGGAEFAQKHGSSADEITTYIQSLQSPAAIEGMIPQISYLAELELAQEFPQLNGTKLSDLAGVAALLTTCQLGRDCSPSAYSARLTCAISGVCGKGLFEGWEQGVTPGDAAAVKAVVAKLTEKITERR